MPTYRYPNAVGNGNPIVNKMVGGNRLRKLMKKQGFKDLFEIIQTDAVENSSGQTASVTYKRTPAIVANGDPFAMPAVRTLETVTLINQVTGANTRARLNTFFKDDSFNYRYPNLLGIRTYFNPQRAVNR